MFTGLIRDVGEIMRVGGTASERVFVIRTQKLDLARESIGASIACNGVCLTVIEKTADTFTVLASAETLSKTTLGAWQQGTRINLEASLRMGDELGGHMVYGHVDGRATLESVKEVDGSRRMVFSTPPHLRPFIAPKGSITLDGVSLTVNELIGSGFAVNIIPHTLEHTNLGSMKTGQAVNMEIDMLARYVARLMETTSLGKTA
jgi:riboflavin synthase